MFLALCLWFHREWPLLTLEERKKILEIVADEVKDRAFIIASVGCISTELP